MKDYRIDGRLLNRLIKEVKPERNETITFREYHNFIYGQFTYKELYGHSKFIIILKASHPFQQWTVSDKTISIYIWTEMNKLPDQEYPRKILLYNQIKTFLRLNQVKLLYVPHKYIPSICNQNDCVFPIPISYIRARPSCFEKVHEFVYEKQNTEMSKTTSYQTSRWYYLYIADAVGIVNN